MLILSNIRVKCNLSLFKLTYEALFLIIDYMHICKYTHAYYVLKCFKIFLKVFSTLKVENNIFKIFIKLKAYNYSKYLFQPFFVHPLVFGLFPK